MNECVNCGHDIESDHKTDETGKFGEVGATYCEGDGFFDDGTPQCDCDLAEEEEDDSLDD